MLDASVILGADKANEISGQLEMPISAALAAGGIVLPIGGITDPKFSVKREKIQGTKLQFVAPVERICALQYRKVVYKWFSSRDLDQAVLDKDNRWITFDSLRELEAKKEPVEQDVLEVDFVDDTAVENGKEVYASEEEEFFF